MRATVWGCRGSLASPGPETVAFGGNTSCVQLELDGRHPGRARRGRRASGYSAFELARLPPAAHPHRPDPPAPRPPGRPRLLRAALGAGPRDPRLGAVLARGKPSRSGSRSTCRRRSSRCSWPKCQSRLTFHDLPDEEFALGSARFLAEPVSHRGPTVGLRIQEHGRTLVYIPDHEPYLGAGPANSRPRVGCRATRSQRGPRC